MVQVHVGSMSICGITTFDELHQNAFGSQMSPPRHIGFPTLICGLGTRRSSSSVLFIETEGEPAERRKPELARALK